MNCLWGVMFGIFSCIGLSLTLFSLMTSNWVFSGTTRVGLWIICEDEVCRGYDRIQFILVVRTFFIFACAALFSALIVSVIIVLRSKEYKLLLASTFAISGISLVIAMAIFTSFHKRQVVDHSESTFIQYTYGYSYRLGWLSFGYSILSFCLCMFVPDKKVRSPNQEF